MAKPACAEAIMGISIGAAAWLGFKVTADKLKDESYESIKSDDSNDQNKQNIKQKPGSSAATGAPDPDDDFDPNKNSKDFIDKIKEKLKDQGWVEKDGVFHHPDAKNMKDIIPNKPNAQDPKLQRLYNELYRPTNKIPGGTMQMLKEEFLEGMSNPRHIQKAEDRLIEITKRLMDQSKPLSRTDYETAQNVQRLLRETIKLVKGG
jgi:hypothetical protein